MPLNHGLRFGHVDRKKKVGQCPSTFAERPLLRNTVELKNLIAFDPPIQDEFARRFACRRNKGAF